MGPGEAPQRAVSGLGHGGHMDGGVDAAPRERVEHGEHLRHGFRRPAGLRDGEPAGARQIERREQRRERVGIDIVHEADFGSTGRRPETAVGEGAEGARAEAGPAGAEHDDPVEFGPVAPGEPGDRFEIAALAGQAEQRQAAVGMRLPDPVERGRGGGQRRLEIAAVQAGRPDGLGEAGGQVLGIGHRVVITGGAAPIIVPVRGPEHDRRYRVDSSPSGSPTTTIASRSGESSRRATRRISSPVTASISAGRRSI